jgi:hypothetical protein
MKSTLLFLRKRIFLFSTLICWGITFNSQAQCGGPSFPASAEILANVPEASGYSLVYELPIPSANQAWATQANVPYLVNNSAALGASPYTRVAYYLKLESPTLGIQWVWVSMAAFTNNLGQIGIPTGDIFWQQQVSNMNILNYAGVNKTGIAGNIEFWSNGYTPDNSAGVPGASDAVSDFGDAPVPGANGYGSFQVHDFLAGQTVLAYNGWAYDGFSNDDLGIGNCGFCSNPDWTFAANANYYDVKELYVFVNTAGGFQPACNPASLSLDASGNVALNPSMVTNAAIGNCGVQSIQLSKTNFTCADLGTNTVTVTVTVNGNPSTCNATVTVNDAINPTVTPSGTTLTLGCNPDAAAINAALGTATATDNCGTPTLAVTTSAVTVVGNNNTQTRTWTATDASGNSATASRTVTWPYDNIAPTITTTGTALTLACNPTAAAINAALGTATVTDNCGTPTLSVITSAVTVIGANNSQTRTWTATDASGNSATASRTVTWPYDNIAPAITTTGTALTLACNPTAAAINAALGTATVTDNCGTPTLSVITSAVTVIGANNSQTRTWTATDASGNSATASRTVTWPYDNIAPAITTTGTALTLACNPTAAAINAALGTATATDNCGTPTLSVTTSAVTVIGANNSQTRTWTATDASGNTATKSRTVTWPKDNTAPVITATGTNLTLGCNPAAAAIEAALGTATATDNCGTPTLSVTTSPVTVIGANNSQTRTWTATDGSNTSTVSRTVTWPNNCNVNTAHIFPSDVSCTEFNNGAQPLLNVCYKTENRKVKSVSPAFFYYYIKVTAPAVLGTLGSFYVDVIQTKTCSGFNLYEVKDEEVYDSRCSKYQLAYGIDPGTGQARILIVGATPGKVYTVAVKYETKALKNSTYSGNTPPVCENNFVAKTALTGTFGSGTLISGSAATLQAKPNCTAQGNNDDDGEDDGNDNHGNDDNNGHDNHDRFGKSAPMVSVSIDRLTITAAPNPSSAQFSLVIKSNDNTPVTVRVIDVYGKMIYMASKISANTNLQLGQSWLPGTYFAEILQGDQRRMVRLVKQ